MKGHTAEDNSPWSMSSTPAGLLRVLGGLFATPFSLFNYGRPPGGGTGAGGGGGLSSVFCACASAEVFSSKSK